MAARAQAGLVLPSPSPIPPAQRNPSWKSTLQLPASPVCGDAGPTKLEAKPACETRQEASAFQGKGAGLKPGKGKGPAVEQKMAPCVAEAASSAFLQAPSGEVVFAVAEYQPTSVPEPPQEPEDLSEGAIYKRMWRMFRPRADGSYLVPEEIISEWKNKSTRDNVVREFEKCGWKPEAGLDLQPCVFAGVIPSIFALHPIQCA